MTWNLNQPQMNQDFGVESTQRPVFTGPVLSMSPSSPFGPRFLILPLKRKLDIESTISDSGLGLSFPLSRLRARKKCH